MQTRATRQLARKLRSAHRRMKSWRKSAFECGVVTENGEPDPGLAIRIAKQDYEPATYQLRARLGLPALRPPAAPRRTPAWLDRAVANLRMLKELKDGS